jgi:glycosyltransferase involved in cell wall biosynthesis
MVFSKNDIQTSDTALSDPNFHVVYLGENGFPIGFGAIQKMILISKALIAEGAEVTVINRKGKFFPEEEIDVKTEGFYEGIHYIYTAGSIYRPKGFIARNFQKIKGSYREFQYLRRLKKAGKLNAAIISCYSFIHVLLYKFYASVLDFPIVYNYVEMARVLNTRTGFFIKINDYLFEKLLTPSMDGAFPISEVLINHFKKIAPKKKWLKIPIIGEFEKFDIKAEKPDRDYFAYCGALDYREVVDFVLKAYDQLPKDNPVDIHLILGGGTTSEYKSLLAFIETLKKGDQVKIFRNVRHADIPKHYKPARALLIPLRNTIQDAARFPHKIAEYVASGNPMISTNFGEVAHYFKDGENALIAKDYKINMFAQKMLFTLENPDAAKKIGENGKQLGLEVFNHFNYGPKILAFLKSLK